jgi:hypothetical protein
MQALTLFILAADLTKMQVNVNTTKRRRPDAWGQNVTFLVDAYPTEEFRHGLADSVPAGGRAERHDLRHDH